jgi:hypothetical protein
MNDFPVLSLVERFTNLPVWLLALILPFGLFIVWQIVHAVWLMMSGEKFNPKSKILCVFVDNAGRRYEKLVSIYSEMVDFNGYKFLIRPKDVQFIQYNGSLIQEIIFDISGKEVLMPNQLIQDPNKQPIKKIEITIGVSSREKKLLDGFIRLGFKEGVKALQNLKNEYDNLKLIFDNNDMNNTLINAERIKKLTDNLYSQGLDLLMPALDISQQLAVTNIDNLTDENKELEEELKKCNKETLALIIKERLEKNTKSIGLVKKYRDRADELFGQVGLCKDSIREIRLELPELMSHKPKDELDKIMLELKTRVEFAQRVHEEYARQGI